MTVPSKKVLLMGRAGAGKTSMRSIVFANYLARDTKRLTATNNIEHSHLRFLGNLVLSLWDCGGQDTFMENYFESQREHIFRNAEVLIYVLEARSSGAPPSTAGLHPANQPQQAILRLKEIEKDLQYYRTTAESLRQFSPNARVFCLIHKMDLVRPPDRQPLLTQYHEELMRLSEGLDIYLFGTSIWDETLFRAWSEITSCLVPHANKLEQHLQHFCRIAGADEVVLFEKSTFLVISHATQKDHKDLHRFEKISNICKQFKLTCGKTQQANFSSLTVQIPSFTAFVERFTLNTYLMLVLSDPDIHTAAALCNIDYAREHFEKLAEQMRLGPTL